MVLMPNAPPRCAVVCRGSQRAGRNLDARGVHCGGHLGNLHWPHYSCLRLVRRQGAQSITAQLLLVLQRPAGGAVHRGCGAARVAGAGGHDTQRHAGDRQLHAGLHLLHSQCELSRCLPIPTPRLPQQLMPRMACLRPRQVLGCLWGYDLARDPYFVWETRYPHDPAQAVAVNIHHPQAGAAPAGVYPQPQGVYATQPVRPQGHYPQPGVANKTL